MKKTIATLTLLAVPATALAATTMPASADTERRGVCGSGTYELSVDREGRGYEVTVDLDDVAAGSAWSVALRHEGKRYTKIVRVADDEGDLDVETFRRGTPGKETFAFTATNGTQKCSAKVTVR